MPYAFLRRTRVLHACPATMSCVSPSRGDVISGVLRHLMPDVPFRSLISWSIYDRLLRGSLDPSHSHWFMLATLLCCSAARLIRDDRTFNMFKLLSSIGKHYPLGIKKKRSCCPVNINPFTGMRQHLTKIPASTTGIDIYGCSSPRFYSCLTLRSAFLSRPDI